VVAQYRIGELAEASGVNTRNIRAYRERGLLDPPVRVGRAAVYSDVHLAQLRVIDQLLAKGFTSSHIADFFAAVRAGHDLADVLGLQQAFSPGAGTVTVPFDVEMTRAESRRMVAAGLACVIDGQLMLTDAELVRIVCRAPDRRQYLRIVVEVFATTQQGVVATTDDVDSVLTEAAAELEAAQPPAETVRVLRDHRELAAVVIARQVEGAVRRSLMRPSA
jgi:DNA-binding transcriptional MerR regulator